MQARELYCSTWFLKARDYVEAHALPWFILSAKYGLVNPDQVIQPYNLTLKDMAADERRAWARMVASGLQGKCEKGTFIIIFAGQYYREYLIPVIEGWGCEIEVPLRGLGIGQQLKWLKNNTSQKMDRMCGLN